MKHFKEQLMASFEMFLEKNFGGSLESPEKPSEHIVKKSLNLEQRKALFVVLEPQDGDMTTDLHGDLYNELDIEKACDNFNKHCGVANLYHMVDTEKAQIVQSFINPSDFALDNDRIVKAGSWLQWMHFPEGDEDSEVIWELVKKGDITGVSINAKASYEDLGVDVSKSLKVKATRRLFNFDFNQNGAHVALVHKDQGGPANGITTLITKSTDDLTPIDELKDIDIEKSLDQVQVNMSMEEFLRKFFDMYHDDAELLTKLMGLETEYEGMTYEDAPTSHKEYLDEKVSRINLMKSMLDNSVDMVSKKEYLDVVKNQFLFESNEEKLGMMVKKALLDEANDSVATLTKSLEDKQAELTKALAKVEEFEDAEKLAVVQKRRDKLSSVMAADDVEGFLGSLSALDETSFDLVVKQLESKVELEDNSDLFVEKGVGADLPEPNTEEDNSLLELIRKNKQTKG